MNVVKATSGLGAMLSFTAEAPVTQAGWYERPHMYLYLMECDWTLHAIGAGTYSADTAKAVPLFQVVRLSV